jgi:hypothetical protein
MPTKFGGWTLGNFSLFEAAPPGNGGQVGNRAGGSEAPGRSYLWGWKYGSKESRGDRMGMLARALSDHLKEISWALLLIFLFLFCLFGIFGRELGFDSVLWVCLGFVGIVTGLFAMIILGELLWVAIKKSLKRLFIENE